jgi:hypothetical protein
LIKSIAWCTLEPANSWPWRAIKPTLFSKTTRIPSIPYLWSNRTCQPKNSLNI